MAPSPSSTRTRSRSGWPTRSGSRSTAAPSGAWWRLRARRMPRNLWLRIGVVVVVVLVSLWYLYPPKERINLGLDLQGGIHLVLGVDTSKAIANQVERAAD